MQHCLPDVGSAGGSTVEISDISAAAVLVDWVDEDEISALDAALSTALACSQGSSGSWRVQLDGEQPEQVPPPLRPCSAPARVAGDGGLGLTQEPWLLSSLAPAAAASALLAEESGCCGHGHGAIPGARPLSFDGDACIPTGATVAVVLATGGGAISGAQAGGGDPEGPPTGRGSMPSVLDIEDAGGSAGGWSGGRGPHPVEAGSPARHVAAGGRAGLEDGPPVPRQRVPLLEHRWRRGLSVTDLTASEWCERQVDFALVRGAPAKTRAMRSGTARHAALEAEVVEVVEVKVATREDSWAVRLLDTAARLAQLRTTGLAREVYVLGFVEGAWMVGVIDELRAAEGPGGGGGGGAMLVDHKTRVRPRPPTDAQKQTTRLQLMCYKLLLDAMLAAPVPLAAFCSHFGLRPSEELSPDVRQHAAASGFGGQVASLADALAVLSAECSSHGESQEELLVRYEWQLDQSLLGEDRFAFEPLWVLERIRRHLAYWRGLREADPVAEGDTWKCHHCAFNEICTVGQRQLQLQRQQEEEERERIHRRRQQRQSQGRNQKKGRTARDVSADTETSEGMEVAAIPSDQRTLDSWLKMEPSSQEQDAH